MSAQDPLDLLHADLIALGQQVDKNRRDIYDHKIEDAKIHSRQSVYFWLVWLVFGFLFSVLTGATGYALRVLFDLVLESAAGGVLP